MQKFITNFYTGDFLQSIHTSIIILILKWHRYLKNDLWYKMHYLNLYIFHVYFINSLQLKFYKFHLISIYIVYVINSNYNNNFFLNFYTYTTKIYYFIECVFSLTFLKIIWIEVFRIFIIWLSLLVTVKYVYKSIIII